MQSLSLHQNSGYQPAAMINRNQPVSVDKHDQIRDAVRAWAGVDGQDVVSALIVEEYQARGGTRSLSLMTSADSVRSFSASWTTISTANGTAKTFAN